MSDVTETETAPPSPNPDRADASRPDPDVSAAETAGAAGAGATASDGVPPVELYWRPGCGFCSSLTRSLDRIGLDYEAHDIWDDEDAAVFVRGVANGNETVPTVRIGDVALINPTAPEVMAEVAIHAPARMPAGYEPPEPGGIGRALRRMLGG